MPPFSNGYGFHCGRTGNPHQRRGDVENLLEGHFGVQRETERPVARSLGLRQITRLIPKRRIGLLQMDGNRVVNAGGDAGFLERRTNEVAIVDVYDKQVVDGFISRIVVGEGQPGLEKHRTVKLGARLAGGDPIVEPPEFDAEHGPLEPIHAVVEADGSVRVAVRLAVAAHDAGEVGNGIVVRRECTAFSVRPQVLAWIEAEGAGEAEVPDAAATMTGAMRLAGVLDDGDPMAVRGFGDGLEVGRTPV